MGFSKRGAAEIVLAVTAVVALLQFSHAAVYKVGDSAGWTSIGNLDYKQWSAIKTFQVGDIIPGSNVWDVWYGKALHGFEYNAQFHNVMRVTHPMYKACNASAPLATYTTGNDTINITTKGHHYFICGAPGHCQAGQKVDINVLRTSETAPTTAPEGSTAASVPSAGSPAPSPSSGISLRASKGSLITKLCLAMAGFAVFVSGFY